MIRRVPSKQRNNLVRRDVDPRVLVRLAWLLVCGLMLAGGFVYAGARHFAALRLGYETEKMRNTLNAAREDARRLMLEREAAASPARLELAARRLGMQPMQPAQIDPLGQRRDGPDAKPVAVSNPLKKDDAKVDARSKTKTENKVR